MPTLAIVFGLLLAFLGAGGYVATGAKSLTALIPALFGMILFFSGIVAKIAPGARKHVMHVAALFGLIGALAGLGRGLPKIGDALSGAAASPIAIWLQIAMGVLCLLFVILCVKSFIDARKAKPEQYGA